MDEARSVRAHMLQRKQRIEQMVTKRKNNVSYLKKFHEGDYYWMNIIAMSKEELQDFAKKQIPNSRVLGYFYLGISLSKIYDEFQELKSEISVQDPSSKSKAEAGVVAKFIRSITQLFEEFEFYFSSNAMQSVKYVMAKNSPCMYPNITCSLGGHSGGASMSSDGGGNSRGNRDRGDSSSGSGSSNSGNASQQQQNINDPDNIPKPNVFKYQSDVVYEFLLTPHIPFADSMDYLVVLTSLCNILLGVYMSFQNPACYQHVSTYDAVIKIDLKVKHHVINVISKELTDYANETLQSELELLRGGSLSTSF